MVMVFLSILSLFPSPCTLTRLWSLQPTAPSSLRRRFSLAEPRGVALAAAAEALRPPGRNPLRLPNQP